VFEEFKKRKIVQPNELFKIGQRRRRAETKFCRISRKMD
jgi:hypothetical protein